MRNVITCTRFACTNTLVQRTQTQRDGTRAKPATPPPRRGRDNHGQVFPIAIVALTVVLIGVMVLAALGSRAADLARQQTAADAAALAAAAVDADTGQQLAAANSAEGAAINIVEQPGQTFASASTSNGDVSAAAFAAGLRTQGTQGLAPALVAALARAEQLLGEPVPIVSGWRSPDQQQALWDNRADNPYPVAAPGTSMHELGLAIDVVPEFVPKLLAIAPDIGLCQPLPVTDPIHFTWCG